MKKKKQTILIADDIEINRALLADMLGSEFEILEAEDGVEAVGILTSRGTDIDLVLLDIVMPKMDGFEVLAVMNSKGWIKDVPVIMISSETSSSYIERAYEMGVTEFINRPFDAWIVRRRVMNTLMLSGKQKKLVGLVTDQIYEREKMNNLMITILSHIVEFRNGESGLHVLHIRTIVDLLLHALSIKTDKYGLTQTDASLIATASALHDIGKIGIPDEILNKPGKFTPEEFEVMKTHTTIGASMLDSLDFLNNEKLVKYAREICRYHHERFDGRGYPDGLKGDEIPISAQIVSIADVYDALTSERVYKKAFSHEKAMEMIINGECGIFNPVLLECLGDISDRLIEELKINSFGQDPYKKMKGVTDELMQHEELSTSARTLTLLENERIKNRFYAEISNEIQFELTYNPPLLMVYDFGERKLGLDEVIVNPIEDEKVRTLFGEETLMRFRNIVESTTPEKVKFDMDFEIPLGGEMRMVRATCRTLFSEDTGKHMGVIGKLVDITKEHSAMCALKHKATHDGLTMLYNSETGREKIVKRLQNDVNMNYLMLMVDLDYFKTINDNYGHEFGNQVLKHVANTLKTGLRRDDIIARFGGDEFLVLLEGHPTQDATVQRIFSLLTRPFNSMPISVSMGVADTKVCGRDFTTLFNCADRAAYEAKNTGKNRFCYYSEELTEEFTALSSIEDDGTARGEVKLSDKAQLTNFLKELRRIFDVIRVYDVCDGKRYKAETDGTFRTVVGDEGYRGSSRSGVGECALMTRSRASGIVYRGNELYKQIAYYIECDRSAYVLEITVPMDDEMLGDIYDKAQLIGIIDRKGGKQYADVGTGTFNKQYFDEQLGTQTDFYSLIVVNFDGSDNVKAGDVGKKIAECLSESVRSTDAVVHGDGNKFAVILKNLNLKRFDAILRKIKNSMKEVNAGFGIGALRALGKISDLIDRTDAFSVRAMNKNGHLVYEKERQPKKGNKEKQL